jgi:HAD superfamily hydrolase (TIGR01509 family)
MSYRPRAVVFDLDGLMFNTEELYDDVGGELLRRRGHVFSQNLKDAMMGRPGRVALAVLIEQLALADSVETLFDESTEIFHGILDDRLALMPGVSELLAALEAAEIPKGIATSSGRAFVDRVLGRFQLAPRFRCILTSEDVTDGKPHPEVYLKAAARLGFPPGDVLVLEDSHHGCCAAAAAGTFAVAVPGDHSRRHDFSGASLVIDTLADPRLYEVLGLGEG